MRSVGPRRLQGEDVVTSVSTTQLSVGVVGLGYLGAVHAACMAELGHRVVGHDVDPVKVDLLASAKAPFFEPGLDDLLHRTPRQDLRFTTELSDLPALTWCSLRGHPTTPRRAGR